MIGFLPCFFIEFRRFFIDQNIPGFPPCFFIKFKMFFTDWHTRFLPQFSTGFSRSVPINKALISNATHPSELASKRESNWNVIKSHNQLHDRSYLIRTISYHNSSRGWPLINHLSPDLPNLFGQLNLLNQSLNQPTQLIFSFNPL